MAIKIDRKCVVCKATITEGDYCDAHLIAKKNLEERFSAWQEAFGELTWEEYLSRIVDDQDIPVGDWAKEVAEFLLNKRAK